jgi:hypothetical protein
LNFLSAQSKFNISGRVIDASNGEDLPGATVFFDELKTGGVSNNYGFYSISAKEGSYTLICSYVGYENFEKKINLNKSIELNIKLNPVSTNLDVVEVKGEAKDRNVTSNQMSVVKMDIKEINKVPALMGEVDILKTIQLLPGVHTTGEGSTGFSVRGGGTDQNLILLDEAAVYNASHLMGFFSIFNNDAIKDLKLYKGDIPLAYGGRLSSLLDVHQKEGNNKIYEVKGGIGLISSRILVEGPIIKDKSSFLIAGRRSYADLFLPFAKNDELHDNKLYFYDFNLKTNFNINSKNRIFASGYFGKDVIKIGNGLGFNMAWGNNTATIRWNHIFSSKLFSNMSLIRSNYNYELGSEMDLFSFKWLSQMDNHSLKYDFTYFLNNNNTLKYGAFITYHEFQPGIIEGSGDQSPINRIEVPGSQALEYGAYISNNQEISDKLKLNYGLRYTFFSSVGPGLIYNFDNQFNTVDSTKFEKLDFYNTYGGLEPRISGTYIINSKSSIKASLGKTMQFVQLASNATVGNPLSVWFPSSPNVEPQHAYQGAIGYFRNFFNDMIETSVEVFYKKMYNQIDFRDHAQLILNEKLEAELRFGEGEAYGAEFLIRKQYGDLTGWIAYTYSKSTRYFDDINEGRPYLSPFDKPHDFSFVVSYKINERLSAAATWVYGSGSPATFPTGKFEYGNMIAPVYSDRNDYRIPDYHRLDLGLTLDARKKKNRKFDYNWVFSVYNAYNRHNTYSISFVEEEGETKAIKTFLFGIIPAITFNFNF